MMLNQLRQLLNLPFGGEAAHNAHGPSAERTKTGVFESGSFAIDDYGPIKVIAIGAGVSGILAGIRFRQYIDRLSLTIYEKQDHIGGTWYVNRYPGVACDIPAHCYQYSFEKKADWSALYSPGAEILQHLDSIVAKYKLEPYIKLRHELTHAAYDEASGKWHVRVKRPSNREGEEYEEVDDVADFLFMGVGILSRWSWPSIEGLHDFKGILVHSADWNLGGSNWEEDVKDWGEKNVAVIGLGSAALQIVSALQDKVGRLSQYVRGRTWVSPPFGQDILARLLSRDVGTDERYVFTKEELDSFKDPTRAAEFRRALDDEMNSMNAITLRGTALQQQAQVTFRQHMESALASAPDVLERLVPDFSVAARRLTPAPGYLRALGRENVEFISTCIERVSAEGIETEDGRFSKHDVIICATGWDVSYRLLFPIIGRNGVDLRDKWDPHPRTYLSVCVDGFPNCFFSCGPNSCIGTGSFLAMIEHHVEYAVKCVIKMQRERLKSMEVKPEAVQDFDELIEHYFPKTVFTEKVRNWYKLGEDEGRIVALWPGSALHAMRTLKHPRWEDFDYEGLDRSNNRLYWMGNGMTLNEMTMTGSRSWFLDKEYVDVPPIQT